MTRKKAGVIGSGIAALLARSAEAEADLFEKDRIVRDQVEERLYLSGLDWKTCASFFSSAI